MNKCRLLAQMLWKQDGILFKETRWTAESLALAVPLSCGAGFVVPREFPQGRGGNRHLKRFLEQDSCHLLGHLHSDRAGGLWLDGPRGRAGQQARLSPAEQRRLQMAAIAGGVRPAEASLTVMGGGYNWVAEPHD